MTDNVIPFRPLPDLTEPPDTLMALLEAAEGLPDATIARLIDHYGFSDVWEPGYFAQPQSDGFRLHAIELDRIGGYEASLEDMPTDEEMDAMIRRAADIPKAAPARAGGGA